MAELPATMMAAANTADGLVWIEVPRPVPKPSEVLVRVHMAGLNRADLKAKRPARGDHSVPGMDWAGEVVAVGAEAKDVQPGERVMCFGSGGYAQYAVTDWGRVMRLPPDFSYERGATLPLALLTAHDALVTNGRLTAGEAVLIQAASSGVGLMALQIAKAMGAGLVIGTSTRADRRARLKEFGADLALDSTSPGWVDEIQAATGGKGVNLIIDFIAGPMMNRNMQAAAVQARIVNAGRLGASQAEFDFDLHALKRIDYVGVTFRTRNLDDVREMSRRLKADLWDAIAAGRLSLPIDRVFDLREAAAAQEYMRSDAHFGKILLKATEVRQTTH